MGLPLYFFGLVGLYKPEYAININKPPCIFRVATDKTKSINNFITAIAANGGMAMSNGYDVEFDFNGTGDPNIGEDKLNAYMKKLDINLPASSTAGNAGGLINMFCDEAQLPNISAAVGQINGRYLGEGIVNYPHTRIVSDFSLSWMCDANMIPFKFLNAWHEFIFGQTEIQTEVGTDRFLRDAKANQTPKREINRTNRLRYPNEYQAILRISKAERGRSAPNERVSLVCVLENVYPYSIDAVPMSYGSSQITRVSANFYYTRHTYYNYDISKYTG